MKKTAIILASLATLSLATAAFASEMNHEGMKGHGTKHEGMKGHGTKHEGMKGHGTKHEGMKDHGTHHEGMKDHGTKHEEMKGKKMDHMFMVKKEVDGYTVSFHVMEAKAGDMKQAGTHNVMVKVEQDGKALNDVVINSKVFYADKTSASKMLMKMGDWYMAGYDLGKGGQEGIMVLFKTSDGKKHKTSVYYPENK